MEANSRTFSRHTLFVHHCRRNELHHYNGRLSPKHLENRVDNPRPSVHAKFKFFGLTRTNYSVELDRAKIVQRFSIVIGFVVEPGRCPIGAVKKSNLGSGTCRWPLRRRRTSGFPEPESCSWHSDNSEPVDRWGRRSGRRSSGWTWRTRSPRQTRPSPANRQPSSPVSTWRWSAWGRWLSGQRCGWWGPGWHRSPRLGGCNPGTRSGCWRPNLEQRFRRSFVLSIIWNFVSSQIQPQDGWVNGTSGVHLPHFTNLWPRLMVALSLVML